MTDETALNFEEDKATEQKTTKPKSSPQKNKGNGEKLQYDGRIGSMYKIFIIDILLRIPTLGIYSFWGKARLRRHIARSYSLAGDRFEYTGTGGELFKGFIKVLPAIIILFLPIVLAELLPENIRFIVLLSYIPITYAIGLAVYGATRYRYSRTRWRGIAGYVGGSTIGYANLSFGRMILNIISLGFAIPGSDIRKHKYVMDNTHFGSEKAEFNGDSRILFGAHIKSILLSLLLAAIGVSIFLAPLALAGDAEASGAQNNFGDIARSIDPNATKSQEAQTFGNVAGNINTSFTALSGLIAAFSYLGGMLFIIFGIGLGRCIYITALMREKMRGLQVGPLRFMCTITTADLIKHKIKNGLILLFTLGLGYPIIVNRNMKLLARHHVVIGDLDEFEAKQAKDQGIASGEGLEAALDVDVGFI